MAEVGLMEAIDNKRLLGAGLKPFPVQRNVLEPVETCVRNVWCLGRRSGKSTMAGCVLAWRAAFGQHLRQYVADGEDVWHVCVAASKEQASVTVGAARRLLMASPLLSQLVEVNNDTELRLKGGHVIAAFVCSSKQTRGWPVATLVFDEFGFFTSGDDGPATAKNVYTALTPSLLQFSGDRRLVISSTPNGDNYFKSLYDQTMAVVGDG